MSSCLNVALPASKLGFISNLSHFPSFHVVEFNSSVSKYAEQVVEFLGSELTKLDSMATFWAKIRYRDFVSELDFFKNQIKK